MCDPGEGTSDIEHAVPSKKPGGLGPGGPGGFAERSLSSPKDNADVFDTTFCKRRCQPLQNKAKALEYTG
jgi:hypothetical protein